MNQDRARALTAVMLSILAHASAATLGNFQLDKAGSDVGTLSVTVAGYTNHAALQSPQDVKTESVTRSEGTSPSKLDIEPSTDPIAAKTAIRTEDTPEQEQTEELPTTKQVKKPKQLAEEIAKPVTELAEKAQPRKRVERKTNPSTSSNEANMNSAASKSQTEAASDDGQESNMASINQTGSTGSTAAVGIDAPIKPDVTAIPLYHLIPKPPYPSRSRDHGEAGTVIIAILVSADGSVADAHVATSSGYPLLDGSALSTVKAKWRFKPATNNGKPVASWVRAPINFSIY